jgi:hypothetical protein
MFATFIRALLGAFGIIRKTKKFTTENNVAFMRSLAAGAVICTGARDPNFIQGGIQGATNSFWQHTLIYIGKTAGTMLRQLNPAILANPKVPREAVEHEIIEAQGEGIMVSVLDKNLGDNQQMVCYVRPLTTVELVKILTRAYLDVGKPYDFLEFIGDAFPDLPIPNPEDLNCCASEVVKCYLPVETICKKEVDPRRAAPADVNNYLEPNLKWQQTRYNW